MKPRDRPLPAHFNFFVFITKFIILHTHCNIIILLNKDYFLVRNVTIMIIFKIDVEILCYLQWDRIWSFSFGMFCSSRWHT